MPGRHQQKRGARGRVRERDDGGSREGSGGSRHDMSRAPVRPGMDVGIGVMMVAGRQSYLVVLLVPLSSCCGSTRNLL